MALNFIIEDARTQNLKKDHMLPFIAKGAESAGFSKGLRLSTMNSSHL